jgi:hypothetical protein
MRKDCPGHYAPLMKVDNFYRHLYRKGEVYRISELPPDNFLK